MAHTTVYVKTPLVLVSSISISTSTPNIKNSLMITSPPLFKISNLHFPPSFLALILKFSLKMLPMLISPVFILLSIFSPMMALLFIFVIKYKWKLYSKLWIFNLLSILTFIVVTIFACCTVTNLIKKPIFGPIAVFASLPSPIIIMISTLWLLTVLTRSFSCSLILSKNNLFLILSKIMDSLKITLLTKSKNVIKMITGALCWPNKSALHENTSLITLSLCCILTILLLNVLTMNVVLFYINL